MRWRGRVATCWPTNPSTWRAGGARPIRRACRRTGISCIGSPNPSATKEPQQHQQDDGTDHGADEGCGLARRIESERLTAIGRYHRTDDPDHDGNDDAARIGARRDEPREQTHDEADEKDPDDRHAFSLQSSNVAMTGTWSDACFQPRASMSMRWLLMAPDSAGEART